MKFLSVKKRLVNSKLIQDSFWSLLGNVIGRGLALVAGIFVARFLGKDIFGEYGMIRSTILSVATFSSFGLGYTATTFVADFKKRNPRQIILFYKYALRITLVFSGVMALGLFITSGFVANNLLDAPHLEDSLRILAILIVFNGLNTTQLGVLSGFGKFKEISRINSITGIITFGTSVTFTYFFSLEGALFALLITQIINWVLNYKEVKKNIHEYEVKERKNKELLKKIFDFSIPVALQEALFSASSWLSNIAIITYASFSDLGMYNAAIQWFSIVLFIPGILRNVVLSHFSSSENEDQHNRILKITIGINFIMTMIPSLVVYLCADIISVFYGTSFDGLGELISIAVGTTVLISLSNVYAQAYMSKSKNWLMFSIKTFRDIGKIILFFFLINYSPMTGAKSMLWSYFVLSALSLIAMVIIYNSYIKYSTRRDGKIL